MAHKTFTRDVLVRFIDPDNLGRGFMSEDNLEGKIVDIIEGPYDQSWILKLNKKISCFDLEGRTFKEEYFLLKPMVIVGHAKDVFEKKGRHIVDAIAFVLKTGIYPTKINSVSDYNKFTMINSVRITFEGGHGVRS